jgi:pimeloyl-ACP methyl ester carboxylesterase
MSNAPATVPPNDEPPVPRRTVVLLPPLLVPAHPLFWPMAWTLRHAGFAPRIFRYPSWRRDIPDNAARLAEWLRTLGEEEVDVVAFSLGGIILRWAATHHPMPRLRRVILLGPPNRGAQLADWLEGRLGWLFPAIWGRCARQLRRGERGLAERAGVLAPPTEFAIIAGGTGKPDGFNRLVAGDNDFTVSVEETLLPGMRDFALVPLRHTTLPLHGRSRRLIVRFLTEGRFRERQSGHG